MKLKNDHISELNKKIEELKNFKIKITQRKNSIYSVTNYS